MKWRIPIALKLVTSVVVLLLIATGWIATNSYNLFEQTSRQREESLTESQARARADEVQSLLKTYRDKISVLSSMMLKHSVEKKQAATNQDLNLAFEQDRDLVNIEVHEFSAGRSRLVTRKTNSSYLKKYQKKLSYMRWVRKKIPLPLASLFAGETFVKNTSVKNGVPLITIGFPLVKNRVGKISHVVIADINVERIQSLFATIGASTIFLVDRAGVVLAHPDESIALTRKPFRHVPIVKMALEKPFKRFQTLYVDPEQNENYIAAYSKTDFGVTVIAQVPESVILEPARNVRREAFFIAGLVLSGALFLIIVFSMSLTSPIERLVDLTKEISSGNFDVEAKKQVQSNDEVGDLATAFDHMTVGLKERDKVKNLFSKFHGSSVADDLIENDVAVGGSNKEVTVFFSDIRGFTAFSESRTPEEVVEMLNEYFERMVSIITRNNGIVDKFIGDAIMAVWGAPQSSGNDAHDAVQACIEMRQSLEELNEIRIGRNQTPIMIGMGLHSGSAISGTIGSEERMEYTVIGDAVNMAARIEASTKAFGTDLLISEITAKQIDHHFIVEEAGAAEVKGKSEPLRLYKIRGFRDSNGNHIEVRTEYSDYAAEKADKVKIAG